MNERQREIIRILLSAKEEYLSVQQIAEQLNVSEKTVRTDFKALDEWLEREGAATIKRRPGFGVRFESDEEERKKVFASINSISNKEPVRPISVNWIDIVRMLLISDREMTIQEAANHFFLSKVALKKELESVSLFLQKYRLTLEVKQRIGVSIAGDEKDKRIALAKATGFLKEDTDAISKLEEWFPSYEKNEMIKVLKKAEKLHGFTLAEQSFEQIILHIFIAVKRVKSRTYIQIPDQELATFQGLKEYDIAVFLAEELQKFYAIKLPKEEIVYIAVHLQGAKYLANVTEEGDTLGQLAIDEKASFFTKKLIERVSRVTQSPFALDVDLYEQLALHLHTTFFRIDQGLSLSNPMLEDIKKMYPYMFEVVLSTLTNEEALQPYSRRMPVDEVGYITIHLQASLERMERKSGNDVRILIVCSYGYGMASLLRTKIERKFHSIEIVGLVPSRKAKEYTKDEADVILSTIPLKHKSIPVIEVSPLFTEDEYHHVKSVIDKAPFQQNEGKFPILKKNVKMELVDLSILQSHRFEVIQQMGKNLHEKGYVAKQYIKSAMDRERKSPTAIGGGIAIPHGDPIYIQEPVLSIGILKDRMDWGTEKVKLVIFIAARLTDAEEMKRLFHEISQLSEDPEHVEKIASAKTKDELHELL